LTKSPKTTAAKTVAPKKAAAPKKASTPAKGLKLNKKEELSVRDEDDCLRLFMKDLPKGTTVLDVPVGTGRFLKFFSGCGFKVTGIDASEEMLSLAGQLKVKNATLIKGDARNLEYTDKAFDAVVCVRLLHLLPEAQMKKVIAEITRVTKKLCIITVQLGKEYQGKDTATHDDAKFRAVIKKLGFEIEDQKRLTGAGWYVMKLAREK
jgi:ubiquinone/menaquinone biosynthesis C-methylase UbiE